MKRVVAWGLIGALAMSLAACGGNANSGEKESGKAAVTETDATGAAVAETELESENNGDFSTEYNWAFATTYGSGTVVVQSYQKFAELAKEYTSGSVIINLYPDGQLVASEDDSMAQLSAGEIEFVGTGSMPWWIYSTDYAWTQAPFMITDADTYENVYNSDTIKAVRQSWADNYNVKDLCGGFYRGMRKLAATKKVGNVGDLSGLKLRMNSSALWNSAWQSLGAVTVPLSMNELYTSIQTGVVEGCENPLSESGYLNIPEVTSYVMNTNHVAEYAIVCMNNDLYESLPENYQTALINAWTDAMDWARAEVEKEEAGWIKKYQEAGCEIVDFDIESAREASIPFWKEMFESGEWAMSYDEVMSLIEECSK